MASYKLYFTFECSPETHWGVETDEEVIIEGSKIYKDGDACFNEDGEEDIINNWEDCVDDATSRWENDDLSEFVNEEKEALRNTNIEDDYATFLDNSEESLEAEFSKEHQFQTSVRSIKVRGVYPTQEEAELRCKMLREMDPNHNIYVGPVGMWVPWEPEAYKTGRVEYLESELNQLMHEKNKNDEKAKIEFESRVRQAKESAIKENIKIAEESGNTLTQNIDENGNLYDVRNNTNETTSVSNIEKELFENENIVLDKV